MPDVFYGQNHLYIACPSKNFFMDFCPIQSVSYSSFAKRKETLRPKDLNVMECSEPTLEAEKAINLVEMVPTDLKVKETEHWKDRDTTQIKDFTKIEVISDWTFSTAYKGTLGFLSNHAERVAAYTSLQLPKGNADPHKIRVEVTEEQIPFERLSPENPILHFGQLYLFECDLEDCGYTMSQVRFRVMADCFYVLLRFYCRVDGVKVRILDTRLFHDFATQNVILR